jgi:hypothetical protein
MGRDYYILNLLPRRTTEPDTLPALPRGMTHPAGEPCPFADDGHPISSMDLCCSLRGEYLAADLEDREEPAVRDRLFGDMNADEALRFATTLRQIVDRLKSQGLEEPHWAPFAKRLATDPETGRSHAMLRSMVEGPLASIRMAADWFEKVARLGFGVECVR